EARQISHHDRHAVIAPVGEDLEGRAVLGQQTSSWLPGTLDDDFRARQLAVKAGFAAARWIVVGQADEGAGWRMNASAHARLRVSRVDTPVEKIDVAGRTNRRPQTVDRDLPALITQNQQSHARTPRRAEFDLGG